MQYLTSYILSAQWGYQDGDTRYVLNRNRTIKASNINDFNILYSYKNRILITHCSDLIYPPPLILPIRCGCEISNARSWVVEYNFWNRCFNTNNIHKTIKTAKAECYLWNCYCSFNYSMNWWDNDKHFKCVCELTHTVVHRTLP